MLFARPPFYQTALKSLFNGLLGSQTHRDEGLRPVSSRRWAETVKLWQWATDRQTSFPVSGRKKK